MLSHPRILTLTSHWNSNPSNSNPSATSSEGSSQKPTPSQWPKLPRLQRWCCMALPATHHDWLQCTALRHLEHQVKRSVFQGNDCNWIKTMGPTAVSPFEIEALSTNGSNRWNKCEKIRVVLARGAKWKCNDPLLDRHHEYDDFVSEVVGDLSFLVTNRMAPVLCISCFFWSSHLSIKSSRVVGPLGCWWLSELFNFIFWCDEVCR